MNFIPTEIEDLIVIEPKVYTDDRGYFYENYKKRELESYLGYEHKDLNLHLVS